MSFRLGIVAGVNPGRWVDTWRGRDYRPPLELCDIAARDAESLLLTGEIDAAFLRLPLRSDRLRRIPLWTEDAVIALSRENELTLLDEISMADLGEETLIVPADDVLGWADAPGEAFVGLTPATTADALDLVAHEAGIMFLPKAIARALHRRDVVLRDFPQAPGSPVGLAWLPDDDGETPEAGGTLHWGGPRTLREFDTGRNSVAALPTDQGGQADFSRTLKAAAPNFPRPPPLTPPR